MDDRRLLENGLNWEPRDGEREPILLLLFELVELEVETSRPLRNDPTTAVGEATEAEDTGDDPDEMGILVYAGARETSDAEGGVETAIADGEVDGDEYDRWDEAVIVLFMADREGDMDDPRPELWVPVIGVVGAVAILLTDISETKKQW